MIRVLCLRVARILGAAMLLAGWPLLPAGCRSVPGKEEAGNEGQAKAGGDEDMARHRATLEAHLPFRDFVLARADTEGRVTYVSHSGRPMTLLTNSPMTRHQITYSMPRALLIV